MPRRKRSPEENERRAKIRELLLSSNISSMEDIQDLFKETIAEFMESGLEAELDDELGYGRYDYRNKDTDNSRNGHSSKTLRTSYGDVEVAVPRDRKGEFEPQILKKNQTSVSQDIEEKILSMYAKGMTTGDIEAHIQDIYGIEVSDTTISRITDKILPHCQGMAAASPGGGLCCGLSGRHPLPRPQRRTDREKGSLYRLGYQFGRKKRCAGDVGRRKRKCQVLDNGTQRAEKPRRGGHFHRLHG